MLDLGCGTGQMLLRHAARFRRAVGVDHSAEMLDVARRRVPGVAAGRCRLASSRFLPVPRDRWRSPARSSPAWAACPSARRCFRSFLPPGAHRRLADKGAALLAGAVDTGGRTRLRS
jgi:SAM-dependent methyltransferase